MGSTVRPLRLFEVLARNRQSALELFGRTRSTSEQPLRMFTIPPRQRLSSPNRLVLRRRNFTHVLNTCSDTQRERERERDNERERNTTTQKTRKKLWEERHTLQELFIYENVWKKAKQTSSQTHESHLFSRLEMKDILSRGPRLTDSERVLTRSRISPLVFAQTTST